MLGRLATPLSALGRTSRPQLARVAACYQSQSASYATQSFPSVEGTENVYAQPGFTEEKLRTKNGPFTKRAFTYFVLGTAGMTYVTAGRAIGSDLLDSMNASADVLAMANVEIDLNTVPEGQSLTLKWRGKPLFVRHRNAEEIEQARNDDSASDLKDPEEDALRVKKPEWLVLLGVCTHLGCVPLPNQGEYNGYFCPCHGSHYDTSGRIRKGPAPLNLEIPPYVFKDEETLLVGVNEMP